MPVSEKPLDNPAQIWYNYHNMKYIGKYDRLPWYTIRRRINHELAAGRDYLEVCHEIAPHYRLTGRKLYRLLEARGYGLAKRLVKIRGG